VSRSTNRSARPLASRALLLVAAVAGTATLLSGCSAGQVAQTAAKVPSVPGVNAQLGDLRIGNAVAEPGPDGKWKAGSDIPLDLRISNVGLVADKLIRVESPDAERVELRAGSAAPAPSESAGTVLPPDLTCNTPGPAAGSASATPSTNATPSASVTPSAVATPSGSVAPSASASAGTGNIAPLPVQQLVINPGCLLILSSSTQQPVLIKLNKADGLFTGGVVTVKLTFERAGETTLSVPIAPSTSPLPRVTVPLEGEESHE